MALKATIYKANIDISDIDRNVYDDHNLTLARHPSETDERMMVRLLAFALNAERKEGCEPLEFGKDMWDPDEPCMVQRDLTGRTMHWIEVGQPEERRISRMCSRSEHVTLYSYGSGVGTWWAEVTGKVSRLDNLTVWQIPEEQSEQLAGLAQRSMSLQITLQEGGLWVASGDQSIEITLIPLKQ